jgi:hypothetical protein
MEQLRSSTLAQLFSIATKEENSSPRSNFEGVQSKEEDMSSQKHSQMTQNQGSDERVLAKKSCHISIQHLSQLPKLLGY